MASYVNMSLDDIIKKKKINTRSPIKKNKPQQPLAKALPVVDARNKIISKKRIQIKDAREKLAELAKQKDARLRLEQLRAKRQTLPKFQGSVPRNHGKIVKPYFQREKIFTDPSRFVVSQPLGASKQIIRKHPHKHFTERRSIESRSISKTALKPIVRTIENDLEIIDDPMEYEPLSKTSLNRKASLQLKIVTHNNVERHIEKERSPPRPPSILKKRAMAALREEKVQRQEKPAMEYRIIVSNLRNTVTGGDIEELFGDVGGMLESRLVRPGTAEVIYKTVEDAQRAVDLYHNRQLDGQPMNCLLVTPRPNASISRSGNKPALYSTNSNVEPDISTFHKVLFSNF